MPPKPSPLKPVWVLLVIGFAFGTARAEVPLALGLPFSDHMVVQADSPVLVWGTGEPGARIRATLTDQTVEGWVGRDGSWRLSLGPQPASTGTDSTELVVTQTGATETRIRITNVLLGEVWLCSGQSNMRFTLGRRAEPRDAAAPLLFPQSLASASHPRLRLLNVSGGTPADQRWAVCSPETAHDFSAVGYFFGEQLQSARDVPVGLIDMGRGGASIRTFLPPGVLARNAAWTALFPAETRPGYRNGAVYSDELARVAPFRLRGVLWYQGESDTRRAAHYARLLRAMIGTWRDALESPALPFLVVQLPVWERRPKDPPGASSSAGWAALRAAQAAVAAEDTDVHLVVGLDLGERFDIHPRRKSVLGARLARVARAAVYGESLTARGPHAVSASQIGAGMVRLLFAGTEGGLWGEGALTTFEVEGKEGKLHQAQAAISGWNTIDVRFPPEISACRVRYGWHDYFKPTLFSGDDWPAEPFDIVVH